MKIGKKAKPTTKKEVYHYAYNKGYLAGKRKAEKERNHGKYVEADLEEQFIYGYELGATETQRELASEILKMFANLGISMPRKVMKTRKK